MMIRISTRFSAQRALAALFLLLLTLPVTADVVPLCFGTPAAGLLVAPGEQAGMGNGPKALPEALRPLAKVDRPTNRLMLPRFEVDTNDPAGTTTLFAVRNVTASSLEVAVTYLGELNQILASPPPFLLPPKETTTVNVRDIQGLLEPDDADGIAEGYAIILAQSSLPLTNSGVEGGPTVSRLITGDYFRVLPGQDFASGDRLLNFGIGEFILFDFCNRLESRFLNGGAFTGGSEFSIVALNPGGLDLDNPTFLATVYDEDGNVTDTCQVFTDQTVFRIPAADLSDTPFGTVEFDFGEGQGQIVTDFDASGRFSVAMRAACQDNFLGLF